MGQSRPTKTKRLTREDWANAALKAISKQGLSGVAVEPIAKELGVTKGSFYWHFENREGLIDAVVEFWKRKNTEASRLAVRDASSLEKGIFYYFEIHLRFS